MNLWTKKILVLIFSGLVFALGQYVLGQWFINMGIPDVFCDLPYTEHGKLYCNSQYIGEALALIAAGGILIVSAIIVGFSNQIGFRRWWHFSRWFLPLTALFLIFCTPIPVPLGQIETAGVVRLLGFYVYLPVTIAIVILARIWHKQDAFPTPL